MADSPSRSTNGAPISGPFDISALGRHTQTGFAAGENRLFVSMYTPLAVATGSLHGTRLPLQWAPSATSTLPTYDVLSGASHHVFHRPGVVTPRSRAVHPRASATTHAGGRPRDHQARGPVRMAGRIRAGSWSRKAEITLDLNGPKTSVLAMRRNGPLAWLDPVASTTTPGSG